jgi:hypothetical protein
MGAVMSGLEIPAMLAIAGTTAKVGSAIYSGVQEKRAANFNARLAREQAEAKAREASQLAMQRQADAERTIGAGAATAGASGFGLGGSAADVLGDLAGQASYDVRATLAQGELDRRDLLIEAEAQRARGRAAMVSSAFDAAGAILDGGYKVANAPKSKPKGGR